MHPLRFIFCPAFLPLFVPGIVGWKSPKVASVASFSGKHVINEISDQYILVFVISDKKITENWS